MLAGLRHAVVHVEARCADAETAEEGTDDLAAEWNIRERVPCARDDLNKKEEEHQEDALSKQSDNEDDNDHQQVECCRPSARW